MGAMQGEQRAMTVAFPKSGPVTLRTNLADYAVTNALKEGRVRSNIVNFDFCGPKVANEGFKPMVREAKFDAGELAIVTFLQAKVYGKPLVMLPAVVMGRFQHQCVVYPASRGELRPKDIEGRRVGIRSYTQTTGVWVRGILQHEYDVDLGRVTWVCNNDAHLAEYRDPPNVERLPSGAKKVDQMVIDGEIDAAILGGDMSKEPRLRPLVPDPQAAALAWSRKYGTIPINHVFVVNKSLADTRPDVVREIYRLLSESKNAGPPSASGLDFHPHGVEALRKPLELAIQYSFEQKIIPRRFEVDELFDETMRALA
jgi:4,5-dihydroxyphthalate decarboxylase